MNQQRWTVRYGMNRLRPVTLLGVPPRAARLVGAPASFGLAPRAQVAATNAAQTECVVTVNNDSQLCVLNGDWAIKKPAFVAQHEQTMVVAAEGGAFRVDVAEDARFLCDPRKLVGTLGAVQTRLVYNESRFDVLRAWTRLLWHRTSRALGSAYGFARHWLVKIPVPAQVRSYEFSLPKVPAAVKDSWRWSRHETGKLWRAATERSFEYTHPPKLEIKGPCSVLIKP